MKDITQTFEEFLKSYQRKRKRELNKILGLVFIIPLIFIVWYSFISPKKTLEPEVQAEILIFSDRYQPSELRVKNGEEVKWINKDDKRHIVVCLDTTRNKPLFDVALLNGESFRWTFYSEGRYRFWDPVEGINGTIIVE